MICHDVAGPEGLPAGQQFLVPDARMVRGIFDYADAVAGEPVLVHCWAGISRSTAVAMLLILRALTDEGRSVAQMAAEAPELLLALRPQAAPNPLILRLGLEMLCSEDDGARLLAGLLAHPVLSANRFAVPEAGG